MQSLRSISFSLTTLLMLTSCHAAERRDATAHGRIAPAASMQDARADHTATLLRDGRVLITGGMVENGVFLDTAELFDPKSGKFEALPKMKERRVGHTASLLTDGRVVIAGGSSGREMVDGNWETIPAMAIEIYDPAQKKFTTAGQLRVPRVSNAGVACRTDELRCSADTSEEQLWTPWRYSIHARDGRKMAGSWRPCEKAADAR
jgi:hypothetical protein